MRNLPARTTPAKFVFRLAILCAVVGSLWVLPFMSSAKSMASSITVTNNSHWEIHHIYLSPADSDNWGEDQLNSGAIHTGESATINVSCDQSQIKVITEDKDGCFLYNTVSCSENPSWTITDSATPDCGN